MNWNSIWTIFWKDWKELLKSRQAILPMIIVPLIFVIVIPTVIIQGSGSANNGGAEILKSFPASAIPPGLTESQQMVYVLIVFFFAPFFLLIPTMIASITAANSFAGEKERKTIEGLLYTPITDRELILAKILVSFIPSVLITWLCFGLYSVVVNVQGSDVFSHAFFPTLEWVAMIFLLAPAISFLALSVIILVSQRASSVWEAQQLSVILVLPIIGLVISQAAGVLFLNLATIALIALLVLLVDLAAYYWLSRHFNRERIVAKMV